MSTLSNRHSGLTARLNAWLLKQGSHRYNRLTDRHKRDLLGRLHGTVIEIGPGTGANLPYYPQNNIRLIGLEPNPFMREHLRKKAERVDWDIQILEGEAEQIPIKAGSVDAVVSTLVLCSVQDLQQSLAEIKRILKPGGSFVFIEHVAAPSQTMTRTVQRLIEPLWRRVLDGCHPDRETWRAIEAAGFSDVDLRHFRLSLPVVGPHIIGKAIK